MHADESVVTSYDTVAQRPLVFSLAINMYSILTKRYGKGSSSRKRGEIDIGENKGVFSV